MTELTFQKKLLAICEEHVGDKERGYNLLQQAIGPRIHLLETRDQLDELTNEAKRITQHND